MPAGEVGSGATSRGKNLRRGIRGHGGGQASFAAVGEGHVLGGKQAERTPWGRGRRRVPRGSRFRKPAGWTTDTCLLFLGVICLPLCVVSIWWWCPSRCSPLLGFGFGRFRMGGIVNRDKLEAQGFALLRLRVRLSGALPLGSHCALVSR